MSHSNNPLPPGPPLKDWFTMWSRLLTGKKMWSPPEYMSHLIKEYGDVSRYWGPYFPIICIANPEYVKEILTKAGIPELLLQMIPMIRLRHIVLRKQAAWKLIWMVPKALCFVYSWENILCFFFCCRHWRSFPQVTLTNIEYIDRNFQRQKRPSRIRTRTIDSARNPWGKRSISNSEKLGSKRVPGLEGLLQELAHLPLWHVLGSTRRISTRETLEAACKLHRHSSLS